MQYLNLREEVKPKLVKILPNGTERSLMVKVSVDVDVECQTVKQLDSRSFKLVHVECFVFIFLR